MIDYKNLPVIQMTRQEFASLEDRSICLGPDRKPGHVFKCNLDIFSGGARWVVGTFYEDEKMKKFCSELDIPHHCSKTEWERVEFINCSPPKHSVKEMNQQISWFDSIKKLFK